MTDDFPRFLTVGDRGLLIEWGDTISLSVNRKVRRFFATLKRNPVRGIIETVPAYRSILLIYDPLETTSGELLDQLRTLQRSSPPKDLPPPRTLEIPVIYGGEYGPDLEWVAAYHGISREEVVRLHTEQPYTVFMIGFTPGFPYLGQLPDALVTPRRATPRTAVPAGSVAIAQNQTGIYPVSSPGGWQILGRTPMRLFDPARQPPVPLEMGAQVRFFSIKEEEMAHWESRSWKSSHPAP